MRSFRPHVERTRTPCSSPRDFRASIGVLIGVASLLFLGCVASNAGYATERRVSPSGENDTLAVRSAIIASAFGDVLIFSRGLYHLGEVVLKSGVTYRGESAILSAATSSPIFTADPNDSHDIRIESFCFLGNGANPMAGVVRLFGSGSPNSVSNIEIANSTFRNNGLTFNFLKGARIWGNRFENITASGAGIYGYHLDNSSIDRNVFKNVYQGMSIILGDVENQGRNIVVAENIGRGISRMGIEIQGKAPPRPGESLNLLVQGNHFSEWINPADEIIGYSIVTDGGLGTKVIGNYVQTTLRTGIGIEISGPNATAERNYVDGFQVGITAYSAGDVITDNTIINSGHRPTSTFGRSDVTVSNNNTIKVESQALLEPDDPGDRRCAIQPSEQH